MNKKFNKIEEHFKGFISELSYRLADESDYEKELAPKLQELMNMVDWVVLEAYENGLGKSFINDNTKWSDLNKDLSFLDKK